MAERRQWLARAGVGAVAAALLVSGLKAAAFGDEAPAGPRGGGGTAAASAHRPGAVSAGIPANAFGALLRRGWLPPMGAFTDSGAPGVQSLAALQTWLGGTDIRVGHTYLPGDRWESIEGGDGLLEPWADWKHAHAGRMFVLNVPMQQNNEDNLSDDEVRDLIQQGASGADDVHFTRLAQRLVSLGVPDTVIVLGWEMNGATYSHRCGPDPEGWKTYWNRIVAAMRAVPGQRFRFDFAPNRGQDAIGWTACYPGDASVDIIGMDSYDQPPGDSFYDQVTEPYGLQAQVRFAAKHKKVISYPEWGLFRNGDDPDYMSLMLAWITAHRPLYQTITDYCPHGVWQCTDNPKSSSVYRAMLYGHKGAPKPAPKPMPSPTPPTPQPTPTPAVPTTPAAVPLPTAPTTPHQSARPAPAPAQAGAPPLESCVPMPLTGDLRNQYEGGQVCVKLQPKAPAKR